MPCWFAVDLFSGQVRRWALNKDQPQFLANTIGIKVEPDQEFCAVSAALVNSTDRIVFQLPFGALFITVEEFVVDAPREPSGSATGLASLVGQAGGLGLRTRVDQVAVRLKFVGLAIIENHLKLDTIHLIDYLDIGNCYFVFVSGVIQKHDRQWILLNKITLLVFCQRWINRVGFRPHASNLHGAEDIFRSAIYLQGIELIPPARSNSKFTVTEDSESTSRKN